MERIKFLNSPVDNVDLPGALDWMESRIRAHNPGIIAVINANKLWLMSRDERLNQFVFKSDLVLPEWAVYWGAARQGTPLKSYVPGVALLQASLPWAEEKFFSPYFLGGSLEVIQALQVQLKAKYPKLQSAGYHDGFFQTKEESQKVLDDIIKKRPDILFVGMGSPRQEYWIEENFHHLDVPVMMGVGGSFDVIAGIKKDTPAWALGKGIEWLYRLSQDPKAYWKRYLICNPWFVWKVLFTSSRRKASSQIFP